MIEIGDLVKIKIGSGFRGMVVPGLSHERGVWIVLKISENKTIRVNGQTRRALIMKGSKQRLIYINRLEKL